MAFAESWTPERARHWWDTHLPQASPTGDKCDQGTIMPQMSSE